MDNSDSVSEFNSPEKESIGSSKTQTSITQEEHMMSESKLEKGESSKKRRRKPLEHSLAERDKQRTGELIKLLKEMTNCSKSDEAEIIDATSDYIRAMQKQIQMMMLARSFISNIPIGMYYGMQWRPPGFMIPPPQFWGCSRFQPPLGAFGAPTTIPQMYRPPGMLSQPQMLAPFRFNPFQQLNYFNPVLPSATTPTSIEPTGLGPSISSTPNTSQDKGKRPS